MLCLCLSFNLSKNQKFGVALIFCNVNVDAGFEFDGKCLCIDGNLLDEFPDVCLIKFADARFLPGDEVLQLLDSVYGFFPAVAVDGGSFLLLAEPEGLVCDGIVVLLQAS